ncbi:MAG: DUF4097 domain-containing protein [Clostridia bacterium]|nr:DUF4097 domain-containing protein [Clostridia bacterium]
MKRRTIIVIILVLLTFTGCTAAEVSVGPKKEVIAYDENVMKADHSRNLEIISDYSHIEIYAWDKKELKMETMKKLRGTYTEDVLKKNMERYEFKVEEKEGKIIAKSGYTGKINNPADRNISVKVYVPKNITEIRLEVGAGTIKVLDDIRCDFNLETKAANIEINRFQGRLTSKSDLGNLRIAAGRLKNGSNVFSNMGNISVKADFERNGSYSFETRMGNIELQLPDKLTAAVDCIGNVEINEFTGSVDDTKIKLQSGMGKITALKYHP